MNRSFLVGLITISAIIVATLWFKPQLLRTTGLDRYIQIDRFSLADIVGTTNNKKCTTASGKVIYGIISKPEDCLKIESIDTHINIVESGPVKQKQNLLSNGSLRKKSDFNCDGRTHCSQMRSCEEARLFLNHCANMQVDGDQDGIPCERQWCR